MKISYILFFILILILQIGIGCGVSKGVYISSDSVVVKIVEETKKYRKMVTVFGGLDSFSFDFPADLIAKYGKVSNDSMVDLLAEQVNQGNLRMNNLKLFARMLMYINTDDAYVLLLDNMDEEVIKMYGILGMNNSFGEFPVFDEICYESGGMYYYLFEFLLKSDYLNSFQNKKYGRGNDKIDFIFRMYRDSNSLFEETARQLANRTGEQYEYGYYLDYVKTVTARTHGNKRKVLKEVLRRVKAANKRSKGRH